MRVKHLRIRGLGLLIIASIFGAVACSPEVGSEAWCKNMKEKPKGDWTANEAKAFAKDCIFK
ncbi:DUF3012 domain-containing protein [Teredinibacter turnerae]|uniref:DUF3012 domain-containing protein n=1 Tax=Teredinibacter turnerae TaxID=2426 RepID=UPI00036AFA1F|nr:DUF3012 domain-containing protein [Teredinibacter turnerae]